MRRATGRAVPEDFLEQERAAAVAAITAPLVLERVAAAYDRPAILVKGPEVAALYPDPALRSYWDVDLLVEDAEEAQRALLARRDSRRSVIRASTSTSTTSGRCDLPGCCWLLRSTRRRSGSTDERRRR